MGHKDYYVAALKGALWMMDPALTLVDISHHISPFSIAEASFQLRAASLNFPEGTVHLIGIDDEPVINGTRSQLPSILKFRGQYFVGSDNGIFALILNEEQPEGFWQIDNVLSNPKFLTAPTKTIFAPTAVKLAKGEKIEDFASECDTWNRSIGTRPIMDEHLIKTHVVHIDHYGNAIFSLTKTDFEKYKDIPFTIYFKNKEYFIDKISLSYNDVTNGERLALFNDAGHLEIAINKGVTGAGGGANALFGLQLGDIARIEFTPRGSAENFDSLF